MCYEATNMLLLLAHVAVYVGLDILTRLLAQVPQLRRDVQSLTQTLQVPLDCRAQCQCFVTAISMLCHVAMSVLCHTGMLESFVTQEC